MVVGLALWAELVITAALVIFSFVVVTLAASWVMDRAVSMWNRRRDRR